MTAFDTYGKYYDLLNEAKDYAVEADYVLTLATSVLPEIKSVLELGCGTGGHAFPLVELGCSVQGIDYSATMIERANARKRDLPPKHASQVDFVTGDIRDFRTDRCFDAVISLFHVMSYQSSDSDIQRAFETARAHLNPDGVFVFDCWYGPAVLADPPYVRSRRFCDDELEAVRTATPQMLPDRNLVNVNFDFVVRNAHGETLDQFSEAHLMRYLFLPEIDAALKANGFKLKNAMKWMTDKPPDDRSWYVVIVAEAQ